MFSSQPLTLYEFFALVVSALGFIAVAISLIFLMKQTAAAAEQSKYVADSLTSSNYAALSTIMFEVEHAFVDYPQLRPYFYEGQPLDEQAPEYDRILAVAANKLGYFSYLLILSDRFPQLWPPHWWVPYIERGFETSPAMRKYVRENKVLYHQELYDLMLKVENRLEHPHPSTEAATPISGGNEK